MIKSQITRCDGSLLENLLNNFLTEISEVSICIVGWSPQSQGRFSHLSLKNVKKEDWWKTERCCRERVWVVQCVCRQSRNPCIDINYKRQKIPQHQSHAQCVGEPQYSSNIAQWADVLTTISVLRPPCIYNNSRESQSLSFKNNSKNLCCQSPSISGYEATTLSYSKRSTLKAKRNREN